ncbi:NAD(P)-binding protein [Cucurbitaria berberidis CBS 394.84]|uniref:NAD(P)-binding protein n=1 Tax=Cucurbitaria berberidis CBS 394.84 TaxID=1168544 RepID=A0A9P4GNS2_9PLEO|nr:NAD(P)-binding protein [Cucurbitaria berberidis CBS 394.84]KAF1849883.1 NAD(P)-binding protein [Cucurbitaria berberidis CBS 394.84]
MTRNICITAGDGHTGFLIAELILTSNEFKSKVDSVSVLCLHPASHKAKELNNLGAKIIPHTPGREREMVKTLKDSGCDTVCLIPPTHKEKFDVTVELINATKKANVPNILFISAAGADVAEREKQPHLREFIDLECLVMAAKGDGNTSTGHSPCIIRAGYFAENLLLYAPQAQKDGILPIPIGQSHLMAPVALGDVAQLAVHVLTGQGEKGFDDRHRGQLMICTGPLLCTGSELAANASKALGVSMEFEDISVAEAKKVLKAQSDSDPSELQYLLEYYSLVREGKTNYISTSAFVNVTGNHPQEPTEFFKVYAASFLPKGGENGHDGHASKKRKI